MRFEVHGSRADGSLVRVRGEAPTLEEARAKVERHGIAVGTIAELNDAGDAAPQEPDASATAEEEGQDHGASEQQRALSTPPADSRSWRIPATIASLATLCVVATAAAIYLAVRPPSAAAPPGVPNSPPQGAAPKVAAATSPEPEKLPPNVVLESDGSWRPAYGYEWVDANVKAQGVRWKPGKRRPDCGRVKAADVEGFWLADPGYRFATPECSSVEWTPGTKHPTYPNIRAAKTPDRWVADAGYRFADGTQESSFAGQVRWVPGTLNALAPNVLASLEEGKWQAGSGYRFANNDPNDMSVVRVEPVAPAVLMPKGPSAQEVAEAAGSLALALVAQKAVENTDDSPLGLLWREVVRQGRDELIQNATQKLFPGTSTKDARAVAEVTGMAIDGDFSMHNWLSQTARDEVMSRLQRRSSALSGRSDMVSFVCAVLSGLASRR